MIIRLLLLTLLATSCVICDIRWGGCPAVDYELDKFEVDKYMGTWYEISRSKSIPFEKGDCAQANYSIDQEGNIVVLNSEQREGNRVSALGKAQTTDNPFRLKVSFSDSFIGKFFKGDYQVLNTDYSSFTVIYSCTDFLFFRMEYAWILSRTPQLPEEKQADLTSYLNSKVHLNKDSLYFDNQDNDFCGY